MPERQALLLGPARPGRRPAQGPRGRAQLRGPSRGRQGERLDPRFERITAALDAQRVALRATPEGLEPETILVLEVAGELTEFARAMSQIPGLEFLGEQALEQLAPDDDFAMVDQHGRRRRYARQLFLVASDTQAWREVLSLWDRWKRGEAPRRGLTPFRDLFAQLRELRPWDDRDRLERGGAAEAWRRDLAALGQELVPFEAELWLRNDAARRDAIITRMAGELATAGGSIDSQVFMPEIDYHGVLGRAPAARLLQAARDDDVSWLSTEGVRLFHATGQMAAPVRDEGERADGVDDLGALPIGASRVALLDGMPLGGHEALDGRLRIDDPESWGELVPAMSRSHGTLMASSVVHGDLGSGSDALDEPVYVRPILRPDAPAWVTDPLEMLPADRLPVDVVHEAVARLFEGDDAAAPQIRVIVLAVGDPSQHFNRFVSPLARLVDWLSWRYEVLILVSAGNHTLDLVVSDDADTADPAELEHEILDALRRDAPFRGLLAPAESANALTIGAAHDDASADALAPGLFDPLRDTDLPNVVNPIARGINRAIKPDLLLPGGRQAIRLEPSPDDGPIRFSVAISRRPPGVKVAAPGLNGELDRYVHCTGTSLATGVAGHAAGIILRQLDQLRATYGPAFPDATLDAVLIKAALAHTARWGAARAPIVDVLSDAGEHRSREQIARFLGHGRARPQQALVADDHRAVLVQAGSLAADATHTYDLPLPASLGSAAVERRLIVTLAWLTPIAPRHRAYRTAALGLTYEAGRDAPFGDRNEADHNAAVRGTLQHEILLSARAVPFAPADTMAIGVGCRATTSVLDDEIPYALIVTIDTPVELQLPIYEQVRDAIPVRVPIAIETRT
jgi:hypothetical protein